VAVHVSAHRKVSLALRRRDWAEAARHFPASIRPNFTAGSLALVVLAGLMWGWFFARLGRWADQPLKRAGLGVLAVALGVASVAPTLAGLFVMDDVLGIRPDGTPVRDAFHYVFSVGLREELSKALAAAVLLPVLWKRNSRLEALVVGSLVGLGFAVEENLGYLERGGAAAALGRFLTANPFHCFATGLITLALFDAKRGGARGVEHALNVFATVVLIHGGYDFMLTSTVVDGLSYFAMAAFFLLVRRYLDEVNQVRRGTPLLPVFVNAIAVVAAAGFIHGAYEHGLAVAAVGLVGGLLGDAILVYAFVQELDRL
jgi:RsiW-degrading membrane proteinase PrsW (M82 family)